MNKKLISQILRFGVIGGIAFLIDYLILILCTDVIHIPMLISSAIAFTVSVVFNYIASVKWVFDVDKNKDPKKNFIIFIILSIVGLILTEIIMWLGTDLVHFDYKLVKIFATGVVMVFNFITRKIFLEENSGVKKKLNIDYKYILYTCMFIVINTIFCYKLNVGNEHTSLNFFLIISLINVLVISSFAFIIKKYENIKLEKMFLIIFIPISICYLLFFPINRIPDEANHFLRINEISEGNLVTNYISWDKNISKVFGNDTYKDIFKDLGVKNSGSKKEYAYTNTSLYSFVCYLPQIVGVSIGKILGLSILLQAYLGRIFILTLFTIMMYYSIKLMPFKKLCVFLIAFLPIIFQNAISLSADALTIATATLFASSIFYFKENNTRKVGKREFCYLSILALIISMCKIVYLPICLLLFIIPKEKFEFSCKKKNILVISLGIVIVAINLFWLSIASAYLPFEGDVNSSLQVKYILSDIFKYVYCIFITFRKNILFYVFSSLGSELGNLNISLSPLYIVPLFLLMFSVYIFDNYENIKVKKIEKLFIVFIVLSTILLMMTSIYIQWTPVGASEIFGIQGRYFIPLFVLCVLLSSKFKIMPKIKWKNKYVYLFLVSINCYALYNILYFFI